MKHALNIFLTSVSMAVLIVVCATTGFAQSSNVLRPKLTPQSSGTTQLLIAVSPVNSQIVWAAGAGGTFEVTTNGGTTWTSGVVPGAEALEFRDVQGVSDKIAYLMSIGSNTTDFRIYKTLDGGVTWKIDFVNETASAFYDCFAFWGPGFGIAHSDSVNGVFPDIRTNDGTNWYSIASFMPPALSGEASFSSSGTCITTQGKKNAWITTGGSVTARILATTDGGDTWNAYDTPLLSAPTAGGFSVAFRDAKNGILGGGDLATGDPYHAETATSNDGGQTWTLTTKPPLAGAIFCLAYANGMSLGARQKGARQKADSQYDRTVVITGETAPDFSTGAAAWTPDEGTTWYELPVTSGYWAVAFANPKAGWFVGNGGQILKISF